jgi:hypothetical protein
MQSPELRPAAVRQNSGEPAAGTGRARAGDDQGSPMARFQPKLGAVGAAVGSRGGGSRRQPLRLLPRRGRGRSKRTGGSGSCPGVWAGRIGGGLATGTGAGRSSTRPCRGRRPKRLGTGR